MKKSNYFIVALFSLYIGGFFVINIVTPPKDFSQMENKTLQSMPKFRFDDLFSGEYAKDLETYVTDQFVFRDDFVEMKSNTEKLLGKDENNGVYISSQNTLIDKFKKPDYNQIDSNINSINKFAQSISVPVYFNLIPTQNDIYAHLLPDGAPFYSQKEVIDYVYLKTSNNIDVYDALMSKNDEYIYYNTDHHWTSLGAYYAYTEIANQMGKTPIKLGAEKIMNDEFNGTIFSKSGVRYAKTDTISIYTDNYDILIEDENGMTPAKIYDETKLENKDKYELFLGGNHPSVKIEGNGVGKLLLIKDSYANSLVPFLVDNFEEIHMIDLRFYKISMTDYIDMNEIDQVLISYSVPNFADDRNIAFLK